MRRIALSLLATPLLLLAACGSDDEAAEADEAPVVDDGASDPEPETTSSETSVDDADTDAVSDAPADGASTDGLFADVNELCAFVQEHLDALGEAAQLGEIEPEVGPVIGRDCAAKNDETATYAAISFADTFGGGGIPDIVDGYVSDGWSQEPAPSVADDAVLVLDPGEFGTEQHHVFFTFGGQIFDVYVENPGEAGFGPTDPQLAVDTAELFVELFDGR
jgi:hypothetical protein